MPQAGLLPAITAGTAAEQLMASADGGEVADGPEHQGADGGADGGEVAMASADGGADGGQLALQMPERLTIGTKKAFQKNYPFPY